MSFPLLDREFNHKLETKHPSDHELADLSPLSFELRSLDAVFEIVESTMSHAGILHIGGLGAVSLAVMLGTMSSLALIIRGTFTYYLHNYAPKGRAINRLMFVDQVRFFQCTTECPRSKIPKRNAYNSFNFKVSEVYRDVQKLSLKFWAS